MSNDYLEINRKNWDSRVPIHLGGYNLSGFAEDKSYLSDVVRFDLARLPEVKGLKGIHLQSHIGTDTISLARLGASMSALDFSGPALKVVRQLAAQDGIEISTYETDVYSAPSELNGQFDFVFTGIGAICWLPDIRKWASVVARLLKPGGFLFMREGHPVLWSVGDSRPDGAIALELDYFEGQEFVAAEEGTYAGEGEVEHPTNVSYNHGIAEIFNALLAEGLTLELFEEHNTVPWNPLDKEFVKLEGIDEWQLADRPNRLPLTYTIRFRKPSQ
jgi:SAM-dependent methyltransferase